MLDEEIAAIGVQWKSGADLAHGWNDPGFIDVSSFLHEDQVPVSLTFMVVDNLAAP